jgi:hypothetical protein
MAIQNVAVQTTSTQIYQSVGDNAITSIIICNTTPFDAGNPTANTSWVSLYAVPGAELNGTTVLPKHTIVNQIPITAGETLSLDQEKLVLGNGDTLFAISDTASQLTITVSTLAV